MDLQSKAEGKIEVVFSFSLFYFWLTLKRSLRILFSDRVDTYQMTVVEKSFFEKLLERRTRSEVLSE